MDWDAVTKYIHQSKALIFPGEEDFGMIPLEVMALGLPVIAYSKGGALESVVENQTHRQESTGLFFKDQTFFSLQDAIEKFEKISSSFSPDWIRAHARKFGEDHFHENFMLEIMGLFRNKAFCAPMPCNNAIM